MTRRELTSLLALPAALGGCARVQSTPEATTTIDSDGTAHITRSVPVPGTLSAEAQALLATGEAWAPNGWTEESAHLVEKARSVYPVEIEETTMAGVPVKIVTPRNAAPEKQHRVLINVHGGAFTSDSGSLLETIPIAGLTGTRVIAVLYRLAPDHPFPAAVEDSIAVYKDVLGTHEPRNVALYGTSAGAILSAETVVRLKQLDVPLPAAVGFFSGFADFARRGDSRALFSVNGFQGFQPGSGVSLPEYVGDTDPTEPTLSPIYADLSGFPPTLCMTGTRDLLLSGTADFHRALLRAGVDARLVVFDALPHAHWYSFDLPESKEALELQARFLDQHLG